jgi:hypothetical protein
MHPSNPSRLATCPDCGCKVRADRLEKHRRKVHGVRKSPRKKHKPAKDPAAIIRAESQLNAYAHKLATAPRKCAIEGCDSVVIPPEEHCEPCKRKQMRIAAATSPTRRSDLCACGAPVMAGESYCYSCIGD